MPEYNTGAPVPANQSFSPKASIKTHQEAHKYSDIDGDATSQHHTLGKSPYQAAPGNHNHDADYSDIAHNHDADYSDILHNHDADYSDIAHNHNADYSNIAHNHDADYSDIAHNHNADYSNIAHNHDADYADVAHTHTQEYPKYVVSTTDTTNTAFTVATKLFGVTIPSADLINGATYRIYVSFDMYSNSAGSTVICNLKHGLSASVDGTSIKQSVITFASSSRRYSTGWVAIFTYSGTSGDSPYNINVVGDAPSAGTVTVAGSTSISYMSVDRIA